MSSPRKVWNKQPPYSAPVVQGGIASRLVFAFNAASFSDGVTQQALRGTLPRVVLGGRIAAASAAADNFAQAYSGLCDVTGDITCMAFARRSSYAADAIVVGKNNANGASTDPTPFNFGCASVSSVGKVLLNRSNSGGYRVWRGETTLLADTDYVFAATQGSNISVAPRFYVNGVYDTVAPTNLYSGAGSGAAGGNIYSVKIANRGDGAAAWSGGHIYAAFVWARILSDGELASLAANPWQLFQDLRVERYFVAPAAATGNTIAVPAGSLVLTGQTPTVAVTDHKTIAVPAGSLVLTGQVPTVALSDNQTIAVPAGSLSLTGFAPTIAQTANNVIAVDAGSLILTGYPPTITGGVATGADVAVGGGAGRRGRRQEFHYVVIDGEDHRVSSVEEAKQILLKLRETAAKRVQRQTRKAVAKAPEAPVVIPPRATVKIDDYSTVFAQQLQAQVDAANAQVAEQYAQAVAAAQAWQRAKQALDEEEDEIETLVLLGIL